MKKVIYSLLLMMLGCVFGAKSQNGMVIQFSDNTVQSFDLQTNGGVFFFSDTMRVIDKNGAIGNYPISIIQKVYFETLSSISNIDNNANMFVYPNPAKNYIKLANVNNNAKVSIFSLDGKMLYNNNYQTQSQIDISSLDKGIYVIKVNDRTFKFSKL